MRHVIAKMGVARHPIVTIPSHNTSNKWWHLTARKLLLAYQKRYWGLVGNYLKTVTGVVNPHLAQVRAAFGRGQGRLLPQLSNLAPR